MIKYIKATLNMTSNNTPSGICSASSSAGTNYQPFYAFNGLFGFDTYTWATTQALPQWIRYQFTEPKCIKKLITYNRNEDSPSLSNHNNRAASEFIFKGSNNGTDWIDLKVCTSSSFTGHYKNVYDISDNNNSYTYYMLYITDNFNNASGTGCGFAEIEMYTAVEVEDLINVGDLEAIKDWFNNTHYTKDEIAEIFNIHDPITKTFKVQAHNAGNARTMCGLNIKESIFFDRPITVTCIQKVGLPNCTPLVIYNDGESREVSLTLNEPYTFTVANSTNGFWLRVDGDFWGAQVSDDIYAIFEVTG